VSCLSSSDATLMSRVVRTAASVLRTGPANRASGSSTALPRPGRLLAHEREQALTENTSLTQAEITARAPPARRPAGGRQGSIARPRRDAPLYLGSRAVLLFSPAFRTSKPDHHAEVSRRPKDPHPDRTCLFGL
jgi:hypothetical protein